MSNSYNRSCKQSKYCKEKELVRSKQRSKHSDDYHYMESKTPPLPKKSTSTLEELLKKRKSLKQELKNIVKFSDISSSRNNRKRAHSKEHYSCEVKVKKCYKENENKAIIYSKKKYGHESSPDIDNAQVESEDEETIIQQRRQQRKQLLAKLNVSVNKIGDSEEKFNNKTTEHKGTQNIQNQHISKQVTDMFSEKDEFESKIIFDNVTQCNTNLNLTDNWDDAEGYYNIRAGDILNNKYTIKGLLGQGVFANVARAQDNSDGNDYVAIKIIRNNELMYKTSLKEIAMLREISLADPENKYHCVQMLGHFMHKGHLCILLESLHMDLRAVIKKYGKHNGLNMKALISYSRQLLLALRLLKKLSIIHADIKPDNILVNEKKNILKLCDFGSAAKIDKCEPTPYLVSRFYRAPEIILGMDYKHGVDIWSTACTIYEMATGKILFTGGTNNKMLKCFMDLKGQFSSRFVKKGKFKDQHFNYNNNFLLHKKDEFTGRDKVVEISNITPTKDFLQDLKRSYKSLSVSEEKKLIQLKDLLEKMTILDPAQRLSVLECLKHPFIFEEFRTVTNKT